MITEHDLRAAIAECEGARNPDANTCIKLAAFYTILNQLYGTETPKETQAKNYSFQEPPEEIPYSRSEFSQLTQEVGISKVFPIMDEVMEMLFVTNKPLYESIIRKIEY